MGQLYTLGIWTTMEGQESEFIEAWQAFADWTFGSQPGAGSGTLLQNKDTPQRFISFGPWESADSVESWRKQPQFKEFVARARELCEDFEPQNMIVVGQSKAGSIEGQEE